MQGVTALPARMLVKHVCMRVCWGMGVTGARALFIRVWHGAVLASHDVRLEMFDTWQCSPWRNGFLSLARGSLEPYMGTMLTRLSHLRKVWRKACSMVVCADDIMTVVVGSETFETLTAGRYLCTGSQMAATIRAPYNKPEA